MHNVKCVARMMCLHNTCANFTIMQHSIIYVSVAISVRSNLPNTTNPPLSLFST
jgi:hypothetical protein